MNSIAPYQIYFPLGILNAILAVGVWFTQNLGWFDTPTILIHSRLIVGGFLWSFIVGFLMTAVPRMTGATSANSLEYIFSGCLLLSQTASSWLLDGRYFFANQMLLVLFMMTYAARRILKSTKPVPVFFSHVALGMILALSGSYFHFQGNAFMGTHLYHLGAVLLLVLGIGTRFFSFLSGLPSEFESGETKPMRIAFHASGVAMGILLFLAGGGVTLAYLGLALLSVFYLLRIWKAQRSSQRPSALKFGVRIVAASIPVSFFMTWMQPLYYVTWLHVIFIGCFGLITFSVATRVTLAHGSYPTDLEMSSKTLWWVVGLLALGSAFRVLYGFSEGLWRISYLHLAATLWIAAVICWCSSFLIKIFKPGPQAKPSC